MLQKIFIQFRILIPHTIKRGSRAKGGDRAMKEQEYKKNSTTDVSFICENANAYLRSSHLIEFAVLFGKDLKIKTDGFVLSQNLPRRR